MKKYFLIILIVASTSSCNWDLIRYNKDYEFIQFYNPTMALTLAVLSNASYLENIEPLAHFIKNHPEKIINNLEIELIESKKYETRLIVLHSESFIFFIFRGTQNKKNWLLDSEFQKSCGSDGNSIHKGFYKGYSYFRQRLIHLITNKLKTKYKDRFSKIKRYYSGHSLGGALATLAVNSLEGSNGIIGGENFAGLYTFGSPRVGNECFVNKFNEQFLERTFRFVNNNDIVTRVPLNSQGYYHVGYYIYINSDGQLTLNYPYSAQIYDSFRGFFFRMFVDGLDDHKISHYIKALEKLENPFLKAL
ncbi:hypothetical protein AB3N62_10930 [Leptospira sp. WS4.C2]